MSIRDIIEKRIQRERQKISDLRIQIERSDAFIQGLQEALKIIPQSADGKSVNSESPRTKLSFRSNSKTKKASAFLKQVAKPMRVDEILKGIGEPVTAASKASMASGLYRAAKKGGEIQNVSPGFFAVKEPQTETKETKRTETKEIFNLPSDFGKEDS